MVLSFISTLYVTESTTLVNPPLSYSFIISLCISLTEISINAFVKTSFWFDSGFKTVTTSIDTHDGLTLGLDSIYSTIYYLNLFVVVLYLEIPLVTFRVVISIRNIYAPIFFPLLTKLRAALWQSFVYSVKCFIVSPKTIDLETPLSISSS